MVFWGARSIYRLQDMLGLETPRCTGSSKSLAPRPKPVLGQVTFGIRTRMESNHWPYVRYAHVPVQTRKTLGKYICKGGWLSSHVSLLVPPLALDGSQSGGNSTWCCRPPWFGCTNGRTWFSFPFSFSITLPAQASYPPCSGRRGLRSHTTESLAGVTTHAQQHRRRWHLGRESRALVADEPRLHVHPARPRRGHRPGHCGPPARASTGAGRIPHKGQGAGGLRREASLLARQGTGHRAVAEGHGPVGIASPIPKG